MYRTPQSTFAHRMRQSRIPLVKKREPEIDESGEYFQPCSRARNASSPDASSETEEYETECFRILKRRYKRIDRQLRKCEAALTKQRTYLNWILILLGFLILYTVLQRK